MAKLVLGQDTAYPNKYEPDVLFAIARHESRSAYLPAELPFDGVDIWNAWELTWLDPGNRPVAATAEIRVPATSPNLVESKSLKLYLGSFAMSSFAGAESVAETIARDLTAAAGTAVDVRVVPLGEGTPLEISRLPGACIDTFTANFSFAQIDPGVLRVDTTRHVEESLHTHLLRSLCPVTSQPDIGSLAIHYKGPQIAPESLLQYVVSFREHSDFHEACIERMFVDVLQQCEPESLSLHARYQRRGGIDINPVRSNCGQAAENLRLWRQ